ncbi:MAG: hypothetical protein ABI068_06920 [Ktedonobacterales bacterium]
MPTRWIDTIRARFIAAFSAVMKRVKRGQTTGRSWSLRAAHTPVFANFAAPAAVHLAYASWLDDGRRLRAPHGASHETPLAPMTSLASLEQQEQPKDATPPRTPPRRYRSTPSVQQGAHLIGATAPATLPLPMPSVSPALASASASMPLSPEGAAPAALAADDMLCEDDDLAHLPTSLDDVDRLTEAQRRLVFLRYLVRQRVYNEGFPAQQTPDQYRPHERQPDDHNTPSPKSDWN